MSDRDGQFDLWLSQVDTGRFLKLTQNTRIPSSLRNGMRTLGFSRDGQEIWFNSGGGPMIVPLLGGTPRVFLKGVFEPAWSTDGMKMVYYNNTDGDPVFVADSTGANERQVFVDKRGVHNHNPVWSRDDQWIYFIHGSAATDEMDVWRMPSSGGEPERVTQHNATVSFLAPLDSRTMLYIARAEDRSGPWLWALDVERKISHRASFGLEQYWSVATSADGRRIVATVAKPSASLWSVPLLGRLARSATSDRFRCLRFVPWRRDSAGRRCFICQHAAPETAGPETGCGAFTMERHPRSGRAPTGRSSSRPPYRLTGSASFSHSDGMGNGASRSCRRRVLGHRRWPHPSTSKRCRLVAGCAMDRHWRSRRRAGRGIVQSAR